MMAKRSQVGDILQRHGIISEAQLQAALRHQQEHGCRMGEALIHLGFCSDVDIARVLAEQVEIPFVDLQQTPPCPEALARVPAATARAHAAVPVRLEGQRLLVAARNPFDIRIDEAMRKATGLPVLVASAAESQLTEVLRRYESLRGPVTRTVPAVAPERVNASKPGTDFRWSGERPEVVQVVDALVAEAVRKGAGSLHLEVTPDGAQVRMRVDGGLVPLRSLSPQVAEEAIARLHIMGGSREAGAAGLRYGECRVRVDGREIELRITTLPGLTGESVTCRLVDSRRAAPALEAMELAPDHLRRLQGLFEMRHGLVLIAGPVDGGKTTLLYALLREAAARGLQALAVEEEYESRVAGVHQLQVDSSRGETLASVVEAVIVQAPDVLMVSALPDPETAAVACRAAAMGPLVLAATPGHGALDAMGRLLDLGLSPSRLATSLTAVVAQRLVPRVCEACAREHRLSPAVLQRLLPDGEGEARCRKGEGCSACFGRGTRGRVAIHELLLVDQDLRYLIAERRPPSAIQQHVARVGFRTMAIDAADKALRGRIPVDIALSHQVPAARSLAAAG